MPVRWRTKWGRFSTCSRFLIGFLLPALSASGQTVGDLLAKADASIRAEQFAAAEPPLQQALKIDGQNTDVLYRLGYVQFRQRKLQTARTHFSAVAKTAPPAYFSRYFLGRIALLENQPAEAVRWLEPIVRDKQDVFDAAAHLASAYVSAGMKAKAVEALQAAVSASPWDPALYYRLGRLYTELGQKELAAEALANSRRLRTASREDVEALMRVADLAREGKRDEAVAAGRPIRDRKSAHPDALVALGVIYGNGSLPNEALSAFEAAVERDPQFFQAVYNHGLALLKLNRASDALEPLARALELLPQSIEANRAYALAAVINRRYADAIAPLERVWASNSADVRTGSLLATTYLRTGAANRAAELLANEAFRNSSDPAPLLLRIEALNATEDPNTALEVAEEVRRRFPQAPQSHLAAAQQLARVGRYNDAMPAFAETLRLAPGHPEAELGLADTLARSGRHAEAVPRYKAAAAHERTSLSARAGMARSLIALRQLEEAQRWLEESIRAYPSDAALRVELSRVYARLGKQELAAEQTRILDSLRQSAEQR